MGSLGAETSTLSKPLYPSLHRTVIGKLPLVYITILTEKLLVGLPYAIPPRQHREQDNCRRIWGSWPQRREDTSALSDAIEKTVRTWSLSQGGDRMGHFGTFEQNHEQQIQSDAYDNMAELATIYIHAGTTPSALRDEAEQLLGMEFGIKIEGNDQIARWGSHNISLHKRLAYFADRMDLADEIVRAFSIVRQESCLEWNAATKAMGECKIDVERIAHRIRRGPLRVHRLGEQGNFLKDVNYIADSIARFGDENWESRLKEIEDFISDIVGSAADHLVNFSEIKQAIRSVAVESSHSLEKVDLEAAYCFHRSFQRIGINPQDIKTSG
jgi:hypothetical protein